jgi:hypothetical protein
MTIRLVRKQCRDHETLFVRTHFFVDKRYRYDKRRALLNTLFHPSTMHVNGHLDAVFVLLESARLRGGCFRFIM